ncbi:serine/threonine-protein kinase [Haliangium ochraceum]|uniref:Serine/threonine protein kinase n=1 Tax=Haliangium ochraceum (strain DSM 14365 / JCM 11303 / SMP-2) TaxID=502025 RepID=D0LME2_HALO1|nr:serine/threonine-protein kinase [Haliangium ochraceum]ACY16848.1 serine/threonine protein kinase [Haliangium ochraceum DSM 14365]
MTREPPTPEPPGAGPEVVELYGDILAPGAVVSQYAIDALVVEGGFAAVYRAQPLSGSGPAVAVKVLRQPLAASPRMVERFEHEALALERLQHPNIVELRELGALADGRPYLIMEWIAGHSLAEELAARGPLAPGEALAVLRELGGALAAAHALGIVHRDLKAQNILAQPRGDWFAIKLIDFGIAKLVGDDDRHQAFTTRTMVGTPATMAPEQIMSRSVDERTDIYALGLLAYQMVTGRLPFEGANAVELEELHLSAPPPPASERAPVSAAFDAALARALAKEKRDRFADVGGFLRAIEAALESAEPASAGRLSTESGQPSDAAAARARHRESSRESSREASRGAGRGAGRDLGLGDARADDEVPGIALSLRLPGAVLADDARAECADELIDRADELARELGLRTVLITGTELLAAGALAAGESDAREQRRRVLDVALALRRELDAGGDGLLSSADVTLSVRCGRLALRADGSPAGGPLLDLAHLDELPAAEPAQVGCVWADAAALAGLEHSFALALVGAFYRVSC